MSTSQKYFSSMSYKNSGHINILFIMTCILYNILTHNNVERDLYSSFFLSLNDRKNDVYSDMKNLCFMTPFGNPTYVDRKRSDDCALYKTSVYTTEEASDYVVLELGNHKTP